MIRPNKKCLTVKINKLFDYLWEKKKFRQQESLKRAIFGV